MWLVPFPPAVRIATRAAALFSVNGETTTMLRRAGAGQVPLLLDVGIPRHILDVPLAARPTGGPFIVLWAAIMESRKGHWLCLETARRVFSPNIKFVIVGDGPQENAARRHVQKIGLSHRVEFVGRMPWTEPRALYRSAHLFLFTSVRDNDGTAPAEALAAGAPLICLDHQDADQHLLDDVAIRIPPGFPRRIVIEMARAIEDLNGDRDKLAAMSRAGRRYAKTEAWDCRTATMRERYASIRDAHAKLADRDPAAPTVSLS